MNILDNIYALDAMSFALMVSPEVADDQHHDAKQDPDIDEDSYLEIAEVLYAMDLSMEEYLLSERTNDAGPTLRGFLLWLLREDER
jgi:hypothetical protein